MSLIPDRVWDLLTDEERVRLREIVDGWRHEPRIVCPQCHAPIGVRLKITAGAVALDLEPVPPVVPLVGAKDAELLDAAKSTGMFDAFAHAVQEERQYAGAPADMPAFFLRFWSLLAPVTVPRLALAAWIDEFGGRIQVFGAEGILLVTSDGVAKLFIPNRFVRASLSSSKDDPQIVPRAAHFERWVKGKFGYVPAGASRFTEALRQRNVGAFGRLVQ
jgi:hypothetical protein